MHPFLIQRPEIAIGAYPFFYGLGLACAGIVEGLLLRARGYPFRDGIRLWAIVCLLIVFGGRLLYFLIYRPSENLTAGWFLSLNQGGEVLYGALIFGTLGGWYACRHLRLPTNQALDAASVGAPLGIAIGRIGCLMKGCCYGARCDWWCGIRYPKVHDMYGNLIGSASYLQQLDAHQISGADSWSLPVHPVPIYESLACVGIAAAMFALWRQRVLSGRLMFVFGATYAVWRFVVEFVRVNARVAGPLTIYQVISIGILAACVTACFLLKAAGAAARPKVVKTGQADSRREV
jgi:phosphatidylglycerol:prolipoprotein diacylglycerol transferase